MSDNWLALNRANWDERVPVHVGSAFYNLAPLRAGTPRLDAIVEAELGSVAGLRLLHLQCHFGKDSLILAGRGADVTSVDFSVPAIEAARRLATEVGLSARFIVSNVYEAPDALPEPASFDLVYVTWGTITWLPDLPRWAGVIAHFLRPGGALYFAEAHPIALVFDDLVADANGRPGWYVPYHDPAPLVTDDPTDYADPAARLVNQRQVNWIHPVGATLNALRGAGLQLEWLHEHPRVAWAMFRSLVRDADGLWTWPDRPWLPLSLSLRAVKP